MNWWGKLIGGSFGFMIGGPLGALLGAALGHNFDRGLAGIDRDFSTAPGATHGQSQGRSQGTSQETERVQSAFFTATFAVMGYLAKVDGRVSDDEIRMARQVMRHMQLSAEQEKVAVDLFAEGKAVEFDLTAVILQFRRECHHRTHLLQMFLEIQIATVLADTVLHEQERQTLFYIGEKLGFRPVHIEQLLALVRAQQHYAGPTGRANTKKPTLADAYAVLGIEPAATDDVVKLTYRRLMNQHHPDKLVAKGLPEEMMRLATEKTQDIKLAYEQIKVARGLN